MNWTGDRQRSIRGCLKAITLVLCLGISLSADIRAASAYPRPGTTRIISVSAVTDDPSTQGNSTEPDISANGRWVTFASSAPDLIAGDTNAAPDVFEYNRQSGQIKLVSVASNGRPATGACVDARYTPPNLTVGSFNPSISSDGRFVAFASCATNLTSGDTNMAADVFVHDRKLGFTLRVSVASDGSEGNGESKQPSISPDGRYVAFQTSASNLIPATPAGSSQVVVYDLKTKKLMAASVDDSGTPAQDASTCASLDPSGRFVSFTGYDWNLIPADRRPSDQEKSRYVGPYVFLHDLATGKTDIASVASDGTLPEASVGPVSNSCGHHSVSRNGRFVTFSSRGSNLVPSDPRGCGGPIASSTFVHDMDTGRNRRVSVTSTGGDPDPTRAQSSGAPSISPDGRYVTLIGTGGFDPRAPQGDCTIAPWYPYVYDVKTGAIEAISLEPREGNRTNAGSSSADGRYGVWSDVVVSGVSLFSQVFLHDRGSDLGVGGVMGGTRSETQLGGIGSETGHNAICISPDLCIAPGADVSARDAIHDLDNTLTEQGANIYGASLAYRPQYEDLFAALELEHMPQILPGMSPIFYGLQFKVIDRSYEVRATSFLGGTFGLFDCTGPCTKVADLRGGYGTTGEEVVFSLPLDAIGLEDGGELSDVKAYSALGSYLTGPAKILDTVRLR